MNWPLTINYVVLLLALLFGNITYSQNPGTNISTDKNCPPEVAVQLIESLSLIVGELGAKQIKMSRLFKQEINKPADFKKLKNEYYEIGESNSSGYINAFEQVNKLSADHPECDKKFLLRLKNKGSAR